MTPQEFRVVCKLIMHSAAKGYEIGRADEKTKKPVDFQQFNLSPEKRQLITNELNKRLKKR